MISKLGKRVSFNKFLKNAAVEFRFGNLVEFQGSNKISQEISRNKI